VVWILMEAVWRSRDAYESLYVRRVKRMLQIELESGLEDEGLGVLWCTSTMTTLATTAKEF